MHPRAATKFINVFANVPGICQVWYDKVLIDATRPLDIPFPEKNKIPEEAMKRIKLSDHIG